MLTANLTADQIEDLRYVGENDIMGARLAQSALDDAGESLIALDSTDHLANSAYARLRSHGHFPRRFSITTLRT